MRAPLLGLVCVAALAWGCASAAIPVVASTSDMASIAKTVGGELVQVQSIAPAGADPEAYEPRASDILKLRDARLVIRVGLGYDYWLDGLVRRSGNARIARGSAGDVDASIGIPLLEVRGQTVVNESGHAHGVANPHYWLDPQNATIVSANIAEHLIALAPADRQRVIEARQRFLDELASRETRWRRALEPFTGVALIAYHDAWPYFARRFGLDVIGFIEPKPGIAPTPSHLRRLIDEGRKRGVRAVIHDASQPLQASEFVARTLHVPLVTLTLSVGGTPATTDYLGLIDSNVSALARGLAGPGASRP